MIDFSLEVINGALQAADESVDLSTLARGEGIDHGRFLSGVALVAFSLRALRA